FIQPSEVVVESAVKEEDLCISVNDFEDVNKVAFEKFLIDLEHRARTSTDMIYGIFNFEGIMGSGYSKICKTVFAELFGYRAYDVLGEYIRRELAPVQTIYFQRALTMSPTRPASPSSLSPERPAAAVAAASVDRHNLDAVEPSRDTPLTADDYALALQLGTDIPEDELAIYVR
ncbi:hypothetical protein PRIPAC_73181, partial [Pristionchus pacificus]|uniref:Uncharacterized protein n=1 Tax=Pristionchus pacificus TaxID=54126 RepID=A0A2A6BZZ4_PRIPA